MLEDADQVCELLCMIIGLNEGFDVSHIIAALKSNGASADTTKSVSRAVAHYTPTRAAVAVASGSLPSTGTDALTRI